MAKLYNIARMTTATSGAGTITLGAAVSGYLTFAQAGVADGDVVSYGIKDGNDSEVGIGTYTSSGTTLTRTVRKSTNSDAEISLSGAAEVFITPLAEDMYVNSNILGTVSESGGVPTGAIIEQGSNASGEYVRFADGTQIVFTGGLLPAGAINSAGSVAITLPAAFINTAYRAAVWPKSATGSGSQQSVGQNMLNSIWGAYATTQYTIQTYRYYYTTANHVNYDIVLVGRWF